MDPMNPEQFKSSEDENTPRVRVIETRPLIPGAIVSTLLVTADYVGKQVAVPSRLRTMKMIGNYGLTFVASGGIFVGVEKFMEHYRKKTDNLNVAVGGVASILPFLGTNGRIRSCFSLPLATAALFNMHLLIAAIKAKKEMEELKRKMELDKSPFEVSISYFSGSITPRKV